jgi:hypothetical protein
MPALKRRAFLAAALHGLPCTAGAQVPFPMHPQGETAAGRMDRLDPDGFRHTVTAQEPPAA